MSVATAKKHFNALTCLQSKACFFASSFGGVELEINYSGVQSIAVGIFLVPGRLVCDVTTSETTIGYIVSHHRVPPTRKNIVEKRQRYETKRNEK
jgi:hypothetical protein